MIVSSLDIQWEDEKINRWNRKNHSLPSFIAKVYEDTKTGRQQKNEHQVAIAETYSFNVYQIAIAVMAPL